MENSSKVVAERENDSFDEIAKLNERWIHRLSLDNPRLAERYLKSELVIIVKVNFRSKDINEKLGVYLQGENGTVWNEQNISWVDYIANNMSPTADDPKKAFRGHAISTNSSQGKS